MTYVRNRMQPASKEYARRRVVVNREVLAPGTSPGARFTGAVDWFRAAAAYAGRRSYRTLDLGEAAVARRDRILADAALMLQERGNEIDALVPASFRRQTRRAELRSEYGRAATVQNRLTAAHGWLLFMARQAERHSEAAAARANEIKDAAAASLIEWAEEMDADDYGE